MSLRNKEITICLALAVALWLAGGVTADDRDFLRKQAAAPNMLFILDTSGSMVGSPETPGKMDGVVDVEFGMVPGGGDDPYSRMGIAKQVLQSFLADVQQANYAFAGYAQAAPADGSNPIPQKHWVYEARTQDRFHLVEANYAYRIGLTYAQSFSGVLLDNPGELFPERLIGYNPYFDPDDTGPTAVRDRFGPVNAFDTGAIGYNGKRLPYDLMPLNFSNCVNDERGTPSNDTDDVLVCKNRVFPLYPSAERDGFGNMKPEEWYYGDIGSGTFPNCAPYITQTATNDDNGCKMTWNDTSSGSLVMRARRVQLNMPLTNPEDGDPNHPLGVLDPDGVWNSGDESLTGNIKVADLGEDDYDLDATTKGIDYDGDTDNDWILYVDLVEERDYRTCGPPEDYPTWTATPTRVPVTCDQYSFEKLKWKDLDEITAEVNNNSEWDMKIIETTIDWEPMGGGIVSFKGAGKEYWKPKSADGTDPLIVDESDGNWVEAEAWYAAGVTKGKWTVKASPEFPVSTSVTACIKIGIPGGGSGGSDKECGPMCMSLVVPIPKDTPLPKDTVDPDAPTNPPKDPVDTKPPAEPTDTPKPATNTPKPVQPTATPTKKIVS